MSDIGEMWEQERKDYKLRRDKRLERRKRTMEWLQSNGCHLKWLSDYQVRINGKLDLYLVNGRYHDIEKNKRGDFSNIKKLIESTFPGITLKDTQ